MLKFWATLGALAAAIPVCAASPSKSVHVRLTQALTSYGTEAGSVFGAVVIAPYVRDGRVVLPPGTTVRGTVQRASRIGVGLVRERAILELAFDGYELPDGRQFPLTGKLKRIDNARETVTPAGQIKGILAANSPQSLVGGMWHVPSLELFPRSFVGLTGAGGKLFSEYSLGPVGAVGLFALRCALFRLPEPEIRLPAGTEMLVAIAPLPADAPSFEPQPPGEVPPDLAAWLGEQPVSVARLNGMEAADIVNIAIAGTREELVNAFRAAGWTEAEPLTPRSVSRAYHAYTAQKGYPSAPVSKLLYRNAEPDLVFQKSLNTMSKRHHIRIWRATDTNRDLWLAAATHDVGVRFDSAMKFTHQIHPRIDAERGKVVHDLAFTGCAEPAGYVARPDAVRTGGDGRAPVSDGRLAVIFLRTCATPAEDSGVLTMPAPPHSAVARLARRMMLEGRQYVLRGNPYYWGYHFIAMGRAQREPAGIEE